MDYARNLEILRRLLDGTRGGAIAWRKDADDWYVAELAGQNILYRFLWFEATNQVGADPA